ncbi:MAG TPA: ABC transporter ATP-binding protein [Usitatibacter sp.]|nr:ABC transporter ATP-binding protein [Usitatibacter sp.]
MSRTTKGDRAVNLTIRDMSKRYANGVQALDKVSLDVSPGMFGLLGPNGAGKSTLMRTLATLQEADSGSATLGSMDVLRDKDGVRRILGYLPQDFGLYPKVTANDMLDHFARLKGISDASQRKATVDALLERTNLADVRHRALGSFSGGMRQRFGIAQALIGNPQLIIVDEPTAGLDPEERVRFHNLLAGIGRETIVILSTHIVDDVADLCPSFAVISKGRVLLSGSPEANTRAIRGKIWRRTVAREAIEGVQKSLPIISSRPSGGEIVVHAYADSAPGAEFESAEPRLEDVYFSAVAGHIARPAA